MSRRTDIQSVLVIGAVAALAGCGTAGADAASVETDQECAERFSSYINRPAMVQLFAGKPLTITYSFDVTELPDADLKALMRLNDASEKSPKVTAVSGPSQEALKSFMAEKVEPRGAIFMSDVSIYRTVQLVETLDKVVVTGCARQRPGMRLIQIDTALAEVTDL